MKTGILTAALVAATTLLPAGATAQTETWKPIGKGTLRDDLRTAYWLLNNYAEFEVDFEECVEIPGRYRLVNAYRNCPALGDPFPQDVTNYLVVDASDPVHVYVEAGLAGYWLGQDQNFAIWSKADDFYNRRYGDWVLADEEGICGQIVGGNITFPRAALLAAPFDGLEPNDDIYDMIWKQANINGRFLLQVPGAADLETSLTGAEKLTLTDDGYIEFDLHVGKDVERVLIGVTEDEWYDGLFNRVADGQIESFEVKESGKVRVPYTRDGVFSVIALPYYEGKPYAAGGSHDTRNWKFDFTEWKPVGKATYTDAVIHSNYLLEYNGIMTPSYTYEVDLEQNQNNLNLVRLVSPYGPCYPEYTVLSYNSDREYYMTFDLTYPDCVLLEKMENGIGLTVGGQKMMFVMGHAARQIKEPPYGDPITIDEARTSETVNRIRYDHATRTLTADKSAIRVTFPMANPGVWYEANTDESFKLVLPEGIEIPYSGVRDTMGATDETARYYDLNGMEVDGSALAPGIYLRRTGSRTEKILVK